MHIRNVHAHINAKVCTKLAWGQDEKQIWKFKVRGLWRSRLTNLNLKVQGQRLKFGSLKSIQIEFGSVKSIWIEFEGRSLESKLWATVHNWISRQQKCSVVVNYVCLSNFQLCCCTCKPLYLWLPVTDIQAFMCDTTMGSLNSICETIWRWKPFVPLIILYP